MAWHVVARKSEIPPNERLIVTVKGREIGIFNLDGEFFAIVNKCPHQGAALCKGLIGSFADSPQPGTYQLVRQGEFLRCPWHQWEFDLRTGQSWFDPTKFYARSINVAVESGGELAKGPFVAETFKVKEEEDYIVVEM